MKRIWHSLLHKICNIIYFQKISLLHKENLPAQGPILYLGLHRNGAVDGLVYHQILPRAEFMISSQLTRSFWGRIFFAGIEVVRNKDQGEKRSNLEALKQCLAQLQRGKELFVFPEGTSSLGPKHLPFQPGAARLISTYLDENPSNNLQVIPLAICYEDPSAFRSKVEVRVGPPLRLDGLIQLDKKSKRNEINKRLENLLENVGLNFPNEEHQKTASKLAALYSKETGGSYCQALKRMEQSIPNSLILAWQEVQLSTRDKLLLTCAGLPLFPSQSPLPPLLKTLLLGPLTLGAAFLNAPALLAGYLAGRFLADEVNVISLWRILVGIPMLLLWFCILAVYALAFGHWSFLALYCIVSWAGLISWQEARLSAIETLNWLMFRHLVPIFRKLQQTTIGEFSR